jgi:hypothetical protein
MKNDMNLEVVEKTVKNETIRFYKTKVTLGLNIAFYNAFIREMNREFGHGKKNWHMGSYRYTRAMADFCRFKRRIQTPFSWQEKQKSIKNNIHMHLKNIEQIRKNLTHGPVVYIAIGKEGVNDVRTKLDGILTFLKLSGQTQELNKTDEY